MLLLNFFFARFLFSIFEINASHFFKKDAKIRAIFVRYFATIFAEFWCDKRTIIAAFTTKMLHLNFLILLILYSQISRLSPHISSKWPRKSEQFWSGNFRPSFAEFCCDNHKTIATFTTKILHLSICLYSFFEIIASQFFKKRRENPGKNEPGFSRPTQVYIDLSIFERGAKNEILFARNFAANLAELWCHKRQIMDENHATLSQEGESRFEFKDGSRDILGFFLGLSWVHSRYIHTIIIASSNRTRPGDRTSTIPWKNHEKTMKKPWKYHDFVWPFLVSKGKLRYLLKQNKNVVFSCFFRVFFRSRIRKSQVCLLW